MPEGDTIFRAAETMRRALAGRTVTRFESVFPTLTRVDDDADIAGRSIESVASRGKHLLITFSGGLVLRTHMRMNGSWHLYRPGERWQRPRRDMRIVIETADFVAVGFNVPVAEFLRAKDLARHKELRALGPDPLGPGFDRGEAIDRIRGGGRQAIGDVLLNQRTIAGIGNVLKSETLFVAGIDPFVETAQLDDRTIAAIVDVACRLMRDSVRGSGRRTTRSMDPRARLWVYGRAGKPCRRCGAAIRARKTGVDARLTYWCPRCQRARSL